MIQRYLSFSNCRHADSMYFYYFSSCINEVHHEEGDFIEMVQELINIKNLKIMQVGNNHDFCSMNSAKMKGKTYCRLPSSALTKYMNLI